MIFPGREPRSNSETRNTHTTAQRLAAVLLGLGILLGTTAASCEEESAAVVAKMDPTDRFLYDYAGGRDPGDSYADKCLRDTAYDPYPLPATGITPAEVSPLRKDGTFTVTPANSSQTGLTFRFPSSPDTNTKPLVAVDPATSDALTARHCLTEYEHQPE
jgi:hypothetical protein